MEGVIRVKGDPREALEALRDRSFYIFAVVGASTRTSTIPGVTAAGSTPEATLYTPTLDVEYLVTGRPITLDVIPVTPEGIPTPALVTRAALSLVPDTRILVVNAGMAYEPRVPHITLPSRRVGGRIDLEEALPPGTSERLYEEARLLAHSLLGRRASDAILVVGETMPAGTTTAASVIEALGYRALGRVSSSMPGNPHRLREEIVRAAHARLKGGEDVFTVNDLVGDPLHVSIAGFAAGASERGACLLLAGGTQMAAVLAILSKLGVQLDCAALATTRWLVSDQTSDLKGLVEEVYPRIPIIAADVSFADAPYPGLRAYEDGYVKEGVGMGGAMISAIVRGGASPERVAKTVYEEYERLTSSTSREASSRG